MLESGLTKIKKRVAKTQKKWKNPGTSPSKVLDAQLRLNTVGLRASWLRRNSRELDAGQLSQRGGAGQTAGDHGDGSLDVKPGDLPPVHIDLDPVSKLLFHQLISYRSSPADV